jgi:hypothetical protein
MPALAGRSPEAGQGAPGFAFALNYSRFRPLFRASPGRRRGQDAGVRHHRGDAMTPNDAYEAEADIFQLKHDAADWEETELDWEDQDALAIAGEFSRLDTER